MIVSGEQRKDPAIHIKITSIGTRKQNNCMIHFVIFALSLWSRIRPTISPKYACTC